jgi:dipeptidase E
MKLLLTSTGICNQSIADELIRLVGIPPQEIRVGLIPTAANAERGEKSWFLQQLVDLNKFGFTWIDIIDFSAPGVDWKERLQGVNTIFMSGGNTYHLLNEVRKHSLDSWLLENLDRYTYIGASAGSVLVTPTIDIAGVEFADINYCGIRDTKGLDLVGYEISPHSFSAFSMDSNRKYWEQSNAKYPLYCIDDETALVVEGGCESEPRVVSEGKWEVLGMSA